ncbi:HupE/UreJ family protein [Bacteriovoracaceae bacterium]|nr:HupE/UreJ family protein [Bacteriovoracaceae bacterium]
MQKILFFITTLSISLNSFAHGVDHETQKGMIDGSYLKYIWFGAKHMITGYDHLLFLFGVIFFLTTFKDIVKFITVFTLGHSVTLLAATFMGITANYWLVDAVIALSVCYKGFDNNKGFQSYLGLKKAPNLLAMVFIFGLIHGFGLSTRLQQLPLGEKGMEMFMRIVSFNVGVEIGQIAALSVMLIILAGFRHTKFFEKFSKVANDGLILAGFLLFLMQLHGYLHTSNPDEFGFSEKGHIEHHMKVNEEQRARRSHGHGHGHDHGGSHEGHNH